MTLVYDPDNNRVIDIETGHTFEYGECLECDFRHGKVILLSGNTAAGLWAWLITASMQFKPKEAK